jgi:hypothetical protein
LRLQLTDFTFQRYDAIFEVTQPLIHGGFIVRRGLRRGRRGGLRLLGRCRKKCTDHPKKQNIETVHNVLL